MNPSGTVSNKLQEKIIFRSKNIVMASGAEPVIPRGIREKFHLKPNAKVFNSDQVLKLGGFQNLAQAIRSHEGKCNVAILGGSHSAFSVIHLLLFGPCQIKVFEDFRRRQLTIA